MALRFFKEDYPELHVVAAGSLLEFTLQELPTFGVGRIHSLFMYPMTFDEFLRANKEFGLIEMRDEADSHHPLDAAFMKIGGIFPHIFIGWGNARSGSCMDKNA